MKKQTGYPDALRELVPFRCLSGIYELWSSEDNDSRFYINLWNIGNLITR